MTSSAVRLSAELGHREQSRARHPDATGYIERDGVRVFYEGYGNGKPTILLLPTWSIVHSRIWKAQIPYLSRHYRVITFDGRGNGRSDRPTTADAYADTEFVEDAVAVMDATATERTIVVGLSMGGAWALRLAAEHPDRVEGVVFEAASVPFGEPVAPRASNSVDAPLEAYEGWAKYNHHYWRQDYPDFLEFFFGECFSEPHSTKQIEDAVGWGLETDAETLILTSLAPYFAGHGGPEDVAAAAAENVQCPALVIHSEDDRVTSFERGEGLAKAVNGELVTLRGSGHIPHARDPVRFNLLLRDFIDRVHPPTVNTRAEQPRGWSRATARRRRALYISSPIGLGHAQRDVAIADELRLLHPDLQIDWLAQHPVTEVLRQRGEHIHPTSALLASESAHIESESGEHDLHAFQAIRRMDEILLANFMLFHDIVRDDPYDLWIGDEAWELDYYLHENPELKNAAYCWLTDFVGWLPMPEAGEREARITADYNAEMIDHIARFPRIRDRAVFVGNPDDIVPDDFGPGLPGIREWTTTHYDFAGYVTGFDPGALADREAVRGQLGYRPDEQICVVAVGGSGVGGHLLRRVIAAFDEAKERVPSLRMVVVAGPRIDPASLIPSGATRDGLEIVGYVPQLYRHLAVCDLAVVQGGLTTTMELAASRTPFLFLPLRNHFEQNFHVRHRLERYRAGRAVDYEQASPEALAELIASEVGRDVDYRPVETDGAARAARLIAEML